MSVGLGLTLGLVGTIAFGLFAARICHMGDLEQDPLDIPPAKQPSDVSLRVVGDSEIPPK